MLRNAQTMEIEKISIVCFHGKKNLVVVFKNRFCCSAMVNPTRTPINIPKRHAANTKSRAS